MSWQLDLLRLALPATQQALHRSSTLQLARLGEVLAGIAEEDMRDGGMPASINKKNSSMKVII